MPLRRRTLLRGIGHGAALSVGLPVLDAMLNSNGTALAQSGKPLPRRYGVFFWGSGVHSTAFYPTATGTNWTPSKMLSPLANLVPYLTIVSGTDQKIAKSLAHNTHRALALAGSWTHKKNGAGDPTEPSVDQLVAGAWAGQTKLDSIEIGVAKPAAYEMSWRRGYQIMPREHDPKVIFDRLFGTGVPATPSHGPATTAPPATKPILESHKSVLDFVTADAQRLSQRLGGADRARVDAHFTAVRDLERRLVGAQPMPTTPTAQPPPTKGAACGKYPDPTFKHPVQGEDFVGLSRVMADLLAVALACDVVRVFSFQLSGALDQAIYWQFGLTQEYHASTHNGVVYNRVQPPLTEMYMASYAYLLEKLKASPEGAGNILDNSLILGTSEFLDAKKHTDLNHPFVIAGRAAGRWKSGQHVAAPGENMTKVLVASVRAVGLNVNGVGDPNSSFYASDPLPGLI